MAENELSESWSGSLTLNDTGSGLLFREKRLDALESISSIARDDNEAIVIALHVAASLMAFHHPEQSPEAWFTDLTCMFRNIVDKYYPPNQS